MALQRYVLASRLTLRYSLSVGLEANLLETLLEIQKQKSRLGCGAPSGRPPSYPRLACTSRPQHPWFWIEISGNARALEHRGVRAGSSRARDEVDILTASPDLPMDEQMRRAQLCDSGLPDAEECLLTDAPAPIDEGVMGEALSRGRWLLGLLILQSTSSFVLDQYQDLLRDHLVVTLFLTMLVGAGGNAGNQSAIKVIRGLATGTMSDSWQSARSVLTEQAAVGLLLGGGLSVGGYIRVLAYNGDPQNATAISLSLFLIVMTSVVLGTGLPFLLHKAGIDAANAGTSIQVVMDILGVLITCVTCNLILGQFALSLA